MPDKYNIKDIDIESTHIHLKTDILNDNLENLIGEQRLIILRTMDKYPQFNGYDKFELNEDDISNNERIIKLMPLVRYLISRWRLFTVF